MSEQIPPSMPPPPRRRLPWYAAIAVVLVGLAVPGGCFHFVYGSGGPNVCVKEGWGLKDTFVDSDEFVGQPLLSLLDRASTVRALIQCGVLSRPGKEGSGGDEPGPTRQPEWNAPPAAKVLVEAGITYDIAAGIAEHVAVRVAQDVAWQCERRAENPETWKAFDHVTVTGTDADKHLTLSYRSGGGPAFAFRATRNVDDIVAVDDAFLCGIDPATGQVGTDSPDRWYCIKNAAVANESICEKTIGACLARRAEISATPGADIQPCSGVMSVFCVSYHHKIRNEAARLCGETPAACEMWRGVAKGSKAEVERLGKCERTF